MSAEETPIDTPAAAVAAEAPVVEEESKAEEPKEEKEEESTATFEPIVSQLNSTQVK